MSTKAQIKNYLASQSESKQSDMEKLHRLILKIMPACQLWFLDGKDAKGKVVSNPNIGYGIQTLKLAGGKTREFYRVGLSANTTGISVYIMGISDKKYLPKAFGKKLGKASVTGYCIKFKTLNDINSEALEEAIRGGLKKQNDKKLKDKSGGK